jgi:hypothetical protein
MQLRSVIFVSLVTLLTSFAAQARVDSVICSLILKTEVGSFRESKASGKPGTLVDNNEVLVTGPYSRLYYRTEEGSDQNVRVAVISPSHYSLALEDELKSLGFLAIAIRDPDLATIEEFGKHGFIYAPEWIRTVLKNPGSIEKWVEVIGKMAGDSKAKQKDAMDRLKAKLAKSEDYTPEVADLDWADYDLWQSQLFAKTILTRNGAIPIWNPAKEQAEILHIPLDPNKPLKGQMVANDKIKFKRVFFRNKNKELIGGSLLSTEKDDTMIRVRAAAWLKEGHEKELATRSFATSIVVGTELGMTDVSYGEDTGTAGVDTKTTLVQFKAQIGTSGVPSNMYKEKQLIKFFPEKIAEIRDPKAKPNKFGGILTYGVAADDPDRMKKAQMILDATSNLISYEDRIEMMNYAMTALQVGAEWDADPLKVYRGMQLREIDRQPRPKVEVAAVNPDVVESDASNVAIKKMCAGANEVARPLGQLHRYMQNLPGATNREADKTNVEFVRLMLSLQSLGIKGSAIAVLNTGDPNSAKDLLAGIQARVGQ